MRTRFSQAQKKLRHFTRTVNQILKTVVSVCPSGDGKLRFVVIKLHMSFVTFCLRLRRLK